MWKAAVFAGYGDGDVAAGDDVLEAAWFRLDALATASSTTKRRSSRAVVKQAQGQGTGRALMEAMHERARRDGIRQIALSVNADNPAKKLYASLGYVDLAPDDPHERMLLVL